MKILLVEDDVLLSIALKKVLEANRYILDLAHDGQAGLELATAAEYDLILLDVQLPKLDGLALCRKLRSQGYRKPILLMTANDSDADAVAGFEAGADDYISKPCAPEVLLARVRTWLRRSGASVDRALQTSNTLTWDTLVLDPDSGRVTIGDQVVALTATEYNLLELFLRNPNRIFSRSAILDKLWGFDDAPNDRSIVTHIKDLRKKLKAGGLSEDLLETVYGMGYRLKPMPQNAKPKSLDHKINQVLERFRDTFDAQVSILEQTRNILLAGNLDTELQQAAQREAHKLAGSLATFGYPDGSTLARSLEHLLLKDLPFTAEEVSQCSELVTALQQTLAQSPVTIPSSAIPSSSQVLIIDDDRVLTERLKAESAAWGLQIDVVANLTDARSWLARSRSRVPQAAHPEVILLDLSFPGEDGLTLLQEITKQSPHLPVIVFTGRDSLADRLAVSRLGARQFLHKPATTEQIFSAIAQVVSIPPSSKAKVLIVDDDPTVLAILSNMLTPWGLTIVTLSDPQQFWQVFVTASPNLLLLDLEMPEVSGLELCQVVRQDARWGDLPILVVTAHSDADSIQQAFAAGADDFITKPVLGPELITRILSRIERTRLHQNPRKPNPNRNFNHETD